MIYNYNKHEILSLLESGRPHIFQELKSAMHDQINDGYQIKISNQIKRVAIEDELEQEALIFLDIIKKLKFVMNG